MMQIMITMLLYTLTLASAQAPPTHADPYLTADVRQALANQSSGFVSGYTIKHLRIAGDAASIALAKLLNESELQDPQVIKRIIPIIREAFSCGSCIPIESDRKPRVTQLLLEHIDKMLTDQSVRQQIADLRSYLTDQENNNSDHSK